MTPREIIDTLLPAALSNLGDLQLGLIEGWYENTPANRKAVATLTAAIAAAQTYTSASATFAGKIAEAVEAWPQFDTEHEQVSGADLVDWFSQWRREAIALLAVSPAPRVVVEVSGGVAEVTLTALGVTVEIIDHDNNEDAEFGLKESGMEIRHDLHGYYVCSAAEAAREDAGNPSVGFDGRPHFATYEDAALGPFTD